MKKIYTNGDLIGSILTWILFILIVAGIILNSWKGAFQAIGLYIFVLIVGALVLQASCSYDNYVKWLNYYLRKIKIFGITIKWFSNGR